MIRIVSNNGSLAIGLVRGPMLDRLLAGDRVCLHGFIDGNGLVHPHICLFVRDNNDELLAATEQYFPDGAMPGAEFAHVSKEEPT